MRSDNKRTQRITTKQCTRKVRALGGAGYAASGATRPALLPRQSAAKLREKTVTAFAELMALMRDYGLATARLWAEKIYAGEPEDAARSSWRRVRRDLVRHGVPHKTEEVDGIATVTVLLKCPQDVEKYKILLKQCGARYEEDREIEAIPGRRCARWLPPYYPFYQRDSYSPDGLRLYCAECLSNLSRNAGRVAARRKYRVSGRQRKCVANYRVTEVGQKAARKARAEQARRPERARARNALARAIRRGKIERPTWCSTCLAPCSPFAFWADYSAPLSVSWHCRACHFEMRESTNGTVEG